MTIDSLAALVAGAEIVGNGATNIDHITHDSRNARSGTLFACVPGAVVDGHDFAADAVANGATAVLAERRLPLEPIITQLVVDDVRASMGAIAASVYRRPSNSLRVVGVTGTNGKTSVVQLIEQIVDHAAIPVRMFGTLTGPRTTPEAPDLQAALAEVVNDGGDVVAMEVSSHALSLHRVAGTHFEVGVFTNLGQDHLDFHGDLEHYEAAKTELFSSRYLTTAVINVDDPAGRRIADQCDVPVRPYRLADVEDLRIDGTTSRFVWEGHDIVLHLAGTHNVMNALAAATTCVELGISTDVIADALGLAQPVRGRFEIVDAGQPFAVVVDYAHKPEALQAVISAGRQIVGERSDGHPGAVIVVLGCGGDRDPFKRPMMGSIAATAADLVVLTSDNPRSEDPEVILDEIEAGIGDDRRHIVRRIEDRAQAIAAALDAALEGDVVLIAGKGDEVHQIVGDRVLPFDDREVAVAHLLATRDASRASTDSNTATATSTPTPAMESDPS